MKITKFKIEIVGVTEKGNKVTYKHDGKGVETMIKIHRIFDEIKEIFD